MAYGDSDTIERHQGLFEGKSSTGNAALWAYCDERSKWFSHCGGGNQIVTAYEQEDFFFNNWYITFCPAFYNNKIATTLDAKLTQLDKNPELDVGTMEVHTTNPDVQGATFFHETM